MNYAVCCIPISALRLEPSHKSEMVSQQLFGELCNIIEQHTDHWIKVACRYDGYEGWCQDGHIVVLEQEIYHKDSKLLAAGWVNHLRFNGDKMMIPMGSSLSTFENRNATWGKHVLNYSGEIWSEQAITRSEALIKRIAFTFINTSYLWGGRSVFGIDCSGFTQSVFKFLNIPLFRDAYQQAEQGHEVKYLNEARCGDLAFFDNKVGKITHVGILLNNQEIIHASAKVRIDRIDNGGIINQDTLERTHQLRSIRSYW